MNQVIIILMNGLTLAALYFLVASGLTLIFGMMRIVNMAHGAFYLLGGYIGWQILSWTDSWALGLLGAALVLGLVGVFTYEVFLRWIEKEDLRVTLVAIGLSLILADFMLNGFNGWGLGAILEFSGWGGTAYTLSLPDFLTGAVSIGPINYPRGRVFTLVLAIVIGLVLWAFITKTRFGMIVRAGVDDREMVSATGINVRVVFASVFFLGSALAGLGGAVGGSTFSLSPGTDIEYLLYSLIVVIVGGMGSIAGVAIGSLLVGLVSQFALGYIPAWASILTFALMVAVLVVRPKGIMGRDQ